VRPIREVPQGYDHPGFPIDQGAVAIEGERIEVGQQHIDLSSREWPHSTHFYMHRFRG
jgi:hypothetical protein